MPSPAHKIEQSRPPTPENRSGDRQTMPRPNEQEAYGRPTSATKAQITESAGDIFDVPENSILLQACNAKGHWGAGVAAEFQRRFPAAYEVYHDRCTNPDNARNQKWLMGTTLLIRPQEEDIALHPENKPYWLGCLITSLDYGRKISPPDTILEMTRKALIDLQRKLIGAQRNGEEFGKCYSVRMNSGLFNIEWQRTKRVLEFSGIEIHVKYPGESDEDEGKGEARGGAKGKRQQPEPRHRGEDDALAAVRKRMAEDDAEEEQTQPEPKPTIVVQDSEDEQVRHPSSKAAKQDAADMSASEEEAKKPVATQKRKRKKDGTDATEKKHEKVKEKKQRKVEDPVGDSVMDERKSKKTLKKAKIGTTSQTA